MTKASKLCRSSTATTFVLKRGRSRLGSRRDCSRSSKRVLVGGRAVHAGFPCSCVRNNKQNSKSFKSASVSYWADNWIDGLSQITPTRLGRFGTSAFISGSIRLQPALLRESGTAAVSSVATGEHHKNVKKSKRQKKKRSGLTIRHFDILTFPGQSRLFPRRNTSDDLPARPCRSVLIRQ